MKKLLVLFFVTLMSPAFSQIYSRIGEYEDGLALVSGYTKVNGYSKKYGYVNEYNQLVIPLKYEYAESFRNGIAVVGMGVKRGMINKYGKIILPIIYDGIAFYKDLGFYMVYENDKGKGIAGMDGRLLVPCKYYYIDIESIKEGASCFVGWQKDEEGFDRGELYDSNGKSLLPNGYFLTSETSGGYFYLPKESLGDNYSLIAQIFNWNFRRNGFCVVERNKKRGVLDLNTGKFVLNPEYSWINIYDDYFVTVKDSLCGLSNLDGTEVYPNRYSKIKYRRGILEIYDKDKCALYDYKQHKELLPIDAKIIRNEGGLVSVVIVAGKQGLLVEESSEFVADCIYDEIIELVPGVFKLSKDGKEGLMDFRDDYLHSIKKLLSDPDPKSHFGFCAPIEYDKIIAVPLLDNAQKYVLCCCKNGKWALGELPNTRTIFFVPQTGFIYDKMPVYENHLWYLESNGKQGLYRDSYSGEAFCEYVPCIYDELTLIKFVNDYSHIALWKVKKEGYYGILEGDMVMLPCEFDEITPIGHFMEIRKNGKCDFVSDNNLNYAFSMSLRFDELQYLDRDCILDMASLSCCYYIAVMIDGKWGYVKVDDDNPTGKIIIKPKFDEAGEFIDGKAKVRKGEDWFYINEKGKKVN